VDCWLVGENRGYRVVFCGLQDWNDGRLGGNFVDFGVGWFFFFFFFAVHHALDEFGDGAFAFCAPGYFVARSEDAEGGCDGDLFYGLEFGGGFGEGLELR